MKYTLLLTQHCNLACEYCYVGKDIHRMSLDVAERIINFAFEHTPADEEIEIGYFGGEPLLEFQLLSEITRMIEGDARYDSRRVNIGLATNGTLLTADMLEFFKQHQIAVTISCDGSPAIHNRFRHFADGSESSKLVEEAIRTAIAVNGDASVNAVYGPQTIEQLPDSVDYFSSLGVRQIHLNADFSAGWTEADVAKVSDAYEAVARLYVRYYREGRPHFISLLDNKITVMLRGGYQPLEKCRMGVGEFAFSPTGEVYPCERLATSYPRTHAIGSIDNGLVQIGPLREYLAPGGLVNSSCIDCSVRDYCVNWCGCCNYSMTGHYNRVGPFLCTSEKTSLRLASTIFHTLEAELGPTFLHHLGDPRHRTLGHSGESQP